MPQRRKKSSRGAARKKPSEKVAPPADSDLISAADALCRCAAESFRQHHRVARLHDEGGSKTEQQVAWQTAMICDDLLRKMTDAYPPTAARTGRKDEAELRRLGNALWRASRAFTNRFLGHNNPAGNAGRDHSSEHFVELRLRHELDASAILSLKQASDAYSAARERLRKNDRK